MIEVVIDCTDLLEAVPLQCPPASAEIDCACLVEPLQLDGTKIALPIWTLIKGTVAGHSEVYGDIGAKCALSGEIAGSSLFTGKAGLHFAGRGEIAAHSGVMGSAIVTPPIQISGAVRSHSRVTGDVRKLPIKFASGIIRARGAIGTRYSIFHHRASPHDQGMFYCKELIYSYPTGLPREGYSDGNSGWIRVNGKNYQYYFYGYSSWPLPSPGILYLNGRMNGLPNPLPLDLPEDTEAVAHGSWNIDLYHSYSSSGPQIPAGVLQLHPNTGTVGQDLAARTGGNLRVQRNDGPYGDPPWHGLEDGELYEGVTYIAPPAGNFGHGYYILPRPLERAIPYEAAFLFFDWHDN